MQEIAEKEIFETLKLHRFEQIKIVPKKWRFRGMHTYTLKEPRGSRWCQVVLEEGWDRKESAICFFFDRIHGFFVSYSFHKRKKTDEWPTVPYSKSYMNPQSKSLFARITKTPPESKRMKGLFFIARRGNKVNHPNFMRIVKSVRW